MHGYFICFVQLSLAITVEATTKVCQLHSLQFHQICLSKHRKVAPNMEKVWPVHKSPYECAHFHSLPLQLFSIIIILITYEYERVSQHKLSGFNYASYELVAVIGDLIGIWDNRIHLTMTINFSTCSVLRPTIDPKSYYHLHLSGREEPQWMESVKASCAWMTRGWYR